LQDFCQGDIGGASLEIDQVKDQGRSVFQAFRRGQGSMVTVIYSQTQQDICDILTPVLVMMKLSRPASQRDRMIVARQFIAWNTRQRKIRPVGHGVIF